MTTMTVRFCTCCGSLLKPSADCWKKCGAPITTGPMGDAIAQQGLFIAAEAAKPVVKTEPSPYARRPVTTAPVRSARPMWHRRCTCGHCMTCIGE
jgi:hypothetical protein